MKKSNFVFMTTAIFLLTASLVGCANKHKAEKIDTQVDNSEQLNGETKLGVKDGDMIVQRKVSMAEELRTLQYEVYEMEDRVFGNRKYGSLGLYGVLRECKSQLSDVSNGGDGKMKWTEPMDRVSDKEEEFKIGLDENNKLIGVTEEYLKDRIARFRGYKSLLSKRQDEYEEKVELCKTDLRSQKSKHARDQQ
jgi:predicted component of type VI protein secretion system